MIEKLAVKCVICLFIFIFEIEVLLFYFFIAKSIIITLTSTMNYMKCGVKTSSEGQEHYILKPILELPTSKNNVKL